jgi:phosphoribosylformylglycinamidine cyclo-ligase
LIRKILEVTQTPLDQVLTRADDGRTLGEALLAPTRIYVKPLLALLENTPVHALAHITGGGLTENLPRVLPPNSEALIERDSWPRPAVFDWLQRSGLVADDEMLRTFNCGIGMVVCVPASSADAATRLLEGHGETVYRIGEIRASERPDACVVYE